MQRDRVLSNMPVSKCYLSYFVQLTLICLVFRSVSQYAHYHPHHLFDQCVHPQWYLPCHHYVQPILTPQALFLTVTEQKKPCSINVSTYIRRQTRFKSCIVVNKVKSVLVCALGFLKMVTGQNWCRFGADHYPFLHKTDHCNNIPTILSQTVVWTRSSLV